MDETKTNTAFTSPIKGGGFFGSSSSFGGVIKKTKVSETSLIKNYESMEKATKDYNKSYKEHLSNLNKLDDYANFSGMKNLFQKVIMKEVITSGAKVDTSMPLLFRNYHIEKEPTPSAFRREHILNQVRYILATSFAGREHMLIKYMSVEIGKSEFILHITTIENLKKSRKLEHNGYVIDAGATRAALKDILSSTKKNLKRRTALVEIGRGSSSRSKHKRTKKSSGSISSLLRSKKSYSKSSGKSSSKSRHGSGSNMLDGNENSLGDLGMNIGSSKESIKSLLASKKREPSNKLTSMIDLKSMKISAKQSKPSMYKRPSEKRPPAPVIVPGQVMVQAQAGMQQPMVHGGLPPMQLTSDFAGKKQDILGGPPQAPTPGFSPYQQQPGQGQPLYPQGPQQQAQPQQYQQQQKPKRCFENPDISSCQADTNCFWDANQQKCKFNSPRNGHTPRGPMQNPFAQAGPGGPGGFGAPGGIAPPGLTFPGAGPAAAPAAQSPPPSPPHPPMMEAI